jgi:hypothetical protein
MRPHTNSRRLLAVALFLVGVSACKGPGGNAVVPGSSFQAVTPQSQTAAEVPQKKFAAISLEPGEVVGTDNLFTPKNGDGKNGGHGDKTAGIPCRPTEYLDQYHVHFYLGIIADHRQVAVPRAIGLIKPGKPTNGFITTAKCFYYIHTHDASGTVHIEVPRNLPYSAIKYNLGQMLSIWGVSHGAHNFGPFSGKIQVFIGTVPLQQVTVSSYTAYTKSLDKIQLQSHEVIWIVIQKKPMAPTSLPPVTFYTEY